MADPVVPADRVVALDALRDRQRAVWLAMAASPMGRARAVRESREDREMAQADEDAANLWAALFLVMQGRECDVAELLDDLDADLLTAVGTAAETLAGLARGRAVGRRS